MQTLQHPATTKVPDQRLITTSVYCPPVCHKRLPLPVKPVKQRLQLLLDKQRLRRQLSPSSCLRGSCTDTKTCGECSFRLHKERLQRQQLLHPPVRYKRLPLPLKKRCYVRSDYHRQKRSKSPMTWRTKAKMSSYERLTPVWASKVRIYRDEYNPSVLHPSDIKLRNDDYNPTALDKAAITTLELLRTRVKLKKPTNKASVCNKCHLTHRHRTISHLPAIVPSLWESDRVQCNR